MNIKPVVSTIVALSLTMGGFAFAQGDGNRGEGQQGHRGHEQQGHRGHEQQGQRGHEQQGQRGAGPDHGWHKGDRLPDEYRNNRSYVVNDWRGHHLNAPPRGYHWVQSGNDFVLVAIASGVIAQLLLDHR